MGCSEAPGVASELKPSSYHRIGEALVLKSFESFISHTCKMMIISYGRHPYTVATCTHDNFQGSIFTF